VDHIKQAKVAEKIKEWEARHKKSFAEQLLSQGEFDRTAVPGMASEIGIRPSELLQHLALTRLPKK